MDFVLKINDRFKNRRVFYFNEFAISLKHNSIASTCAFRFYFDPENPEHKEFACPSHIHIFTLEYKGQTIVKGYLIAQKYKVSAVKELTELRGYSLPGFLEDCEIPPQRYPLQSNGVSLKAIATNLLRDFRDIDLEVDPQVESLVNQKYDVSEAGSGQKIKDYLAQLAQQKDIILGHTLDGKLYLTKSKTDAAPILDFDLTKGTIPGVEFTFEWNSQGMHSHIYMQRQADMEGGNAGYYAQRNYYVPVVFRPTTMSQTSGKSNDTQKAARRALANELRGGKMTIKISRWEAIVGSGIITPNNTITVYGPELFHYYKIKWFIESIDFNGNEKETVATLHCVLPEVYSFEVPTNDTTIFRRINFERQHT